MFLVDVIAIHGENCGLKVEVEVLVIRVFFLEESSDNSFRNVSSE